MTEPASTDIDEQVRVFRDRLKTVSAIDRDQASGTAAKLFKDLASAPTSQVAGRVLLEWAAKHSDAIALRNSVVTATVAQYGLFIVFDAPDAFLRGRDGHLSRLHTIKITCRLLGININEVH